MQQQSSKVKLLPIAKNSSKLKEDITSLGSDDSGICGSDSSAETRPKGSEETIATEDAKVNFTKISTIKITNKIIQLLV
jgi:hypothetical protein